MKMNEQEAQNFSCELVKIALSNPAYTGLYLNGNSAEDIAAFIRILSDKLCSGEK